MVQYQQNEQFKVHIDGYDLIVLTISGSITIQSSGNTTLALPEHQYAFVPAGVSHGFKATTDGPVRLLFIEIN
jgi:quercetin dioxygenase-like cupin family protein